MQCRYLTGENIRPRSAEEARKLIGKKITYLREQDIDRSGRGYFFPRQGEVTSVQGRNIEFGNGDWQTLSSLVEVVERSDIAANAEGAGA